MIIPNIKLSFTTGTASNERRSLFPGLRIALISGSFLISSIVRGCSFLNTFSISPSSSLRQNTVIDSLPAPLAASIQITFSPGLVRHIEQRSLLRESATTCAIVSRISLSSSVELATWATLIKMSVAGDFISGCLFSVISAISSLI